MNTQRSGCERGQDARFRSREAGQVVVLGLLFVVALPLAAQDKKVSGTAESGKHPSSVGFIASNEASEKEVGLPLYPGARPHKDDSNDSSAIQLGLWGGSSGFKLAVLTLESNDAPEKVAAFYRKALAKYGRVLDCANSSKSTVEKEKGKSSNELGCEDERPESGGFVLKAGTKEEQHVVGIEAKGGLAVFHLVYVETRIPDSKE
jgi:hypothetical protein